MFSIFPEDCDDGDGSAGGGCGENLCIGRVGVRGEARLVVDGDGRVLSEWIRLMRGEALELSVRWSVSDAPYDAEPSLSMNVVLPMNVVPRSGTMLFADTVWDGLHVLSRRNEVSVKAPEFTDRFGR